ncbi:MAG TPA: hypothetical protein VMX54_04990 [Vicinamibacteria bacterium]|nr:hypothetical protein [Vicinamibacteria bacterium]
MVPGRITEVELKYVESVAAALTAGMPGVSEGETSLAWDLLRHVAEVRRLRELVLLAAASAESKLPLHADLVAEAEAIRSEPS